MSALTDVTPDNSTDNQPPAEAIPAAGQSASATVTDAQPAMLAIAPQPTVSRCAADSPPR
jgi:hypothetical protein